MTCRLVMRLPSAVPEELRAYQLQMTVAGERWPEKSEQVSQVDFLLQIRQGAGTKEPRWQDARDGATTLHSR